MDEQVRSAIATLKSGGIVIFPTDTAFGIGCRIDNPDAVKRLYSLRRRPEYQAAPALVDGIAMALGYFRNPPDAATALMRRYWPGGLTVVAGCRTELVAPLARGGGETVGLRQPDHDVARLLVSGVGVPVLAPSANFHGNPTPFTYESLDSELVALADAVVPGQCHTSAVSTVVDTTKTPPVVLRQGAVRIDWSIL